LVQSSRWAGRETQCGACFVAIDDQGGIVGFYSLSSSTLAITDLPPAHAKRLPRYDAIPAALIGRLARDKKVRGEGVGDLLLADAVRRVIGAARSLAVFAIVVEATDEKRGGLLSRLWIRAISESPAQTVHACVRSGGGCFPCAVAVSHRSLSSPDGCGKPGL